MLSLGGRKNVGRGGGVYPSGPSMPIGNELRFEADTASALRDGVLGTQDGDSVDVDVNRALSAEHAARPRTVPHIGCTQLYTSFT